MSKYVDKRNLIQYKYFHNMLEKEEERKDLVADILTAEELMRNGDKRQKNEGLLMLSKARNRIPDFLYLDEDLRKKCKADLSTKNHKELVKKVEQYANILMILQRFQGNVLVKKDFLEKEKQQRMSKDYLEQHYKREKMSGRYYKPSPCIPKLLLVNEELYQSYFHSPYTEKEWEELNQLMRPDTFYIINVQVQSQEDVSYMVEKVENLCMYALLKDRTRQITVGKTISEQTEVASVLFCLLDYLKEIEQEEQKRRKYQEAHPSETSHAKKTWTAPRYEDKDAIKVFDMKGNTADYVGGTYYLHRKNGGGGHRKIGYEMMPHTRKGHYRTYKNGKRVYVRASVIHKEKYEGIQSAHRINQTERNDASNTELEENTFSQGMSM